MVAVASTVNFWWDRFTSVWEHIQQRSFERSLQKQTGTVQWPVGCPAEAKLLLAAGAG